MALRPTLSRGLPFTEEKLLYRDSNVFEFANLRADYATAVPKSKMWQLSRFGSPNGATATSEV